MAAVIGSCPDLVLPDVQLERAEARLQLLVQLLADPTTTQVGQISFTTSPNGAEALEQIALHLCMACDCPPYHASMALAPGSEGMHFSAAGAPR